MNRRALIVFVILNIAISIGVAMLVIALWQSGQEEQPGEPVVQVFEVVITATAGPTQTPWIVTVESDAPFTAPQTGADGGDTGGDPTVAPTLNENILPQIATDAAATQIALQSSGSQEQTYTVQSGDNPSIIAEAFEVSLEDLLCANDLGTVDEPDFIYEGQVLIIPGPAFVCDPAAVAAAAAEEAADAGAEEEGAEAETGDGTDAPESTLDAAGILGGTTEAPGIPTVTLAPTAENAQVVIVEVVGAGDVTREGVVLRNEGGLVDLAGWTIYDTEGNIFTFPDYRLFADSGLTVFSGTGEDTAIALFWDETRAIWQPGDVVSLADEDGVVQSTLRVEVGASEADG